MRMLNEEYNITIEGGRIKDLEIKQVVITNILRRGKGTNGNPVRIIEQCWDFNGTLLYEKDRWLESQNLKKKVKNE